MTRKILTFIFDSDTRIDQSLLKDQEGVTAETFHYELVKDYPQIREYIIENSLREFSLYYITITKDNIYIIRPVEQAFRVHFPLSQLSGKDKDGVFGDLINNRYQALDKCFDDHLDDRDCETCY